MRATRDEVTAHWEALNSHCFTASGRLLVYDDNNLAHRPPADCQDLLNDGQTLSGVYIIYRNVLSTPMAIPVYCDMTTDGGGWIVIQRRMDGSVNFTRGWHEYKIGFGNLSGEFWFGNDFIAFLTLGRPQQLRIDLGDFSSQTRYAKYSNFSVAPSSDKYRLRITGYSGDAGNSLGNYANNAFFSTVDVDNDSRSSGACTQVYNPGGWWFTNCINSDLNGPYTSNGRARRSQGGVYWSGWRGSSYSLKTSKMMIKPAV
jgi:hypothetical protein